MFARHTRARMRGSGIVQSLKSLASKLHPQLPLSPKESQRLLTALTSSFREKLDEAHPPRAQDGDSRPKLDHSRGLNSGHHVLHTSSVAFADKHLASVLTNPLLAKSDGTKKTALNLESAKRELEQNPDRDPISVLEEYHEEGAATIPIANLCLRTFMDSVTGLPRESRQGTVAKAEAGVRTLHWLWTSKLFETDEFVNDRRLMGAIVTMVIAEDREQFLWSWLRLDQRHNAQKDASGRPRDHDPSHLYRWKDFMIRMLALNRYDNTNPGSMNEVFDIWFKAVDLKLDVARDLTTNHIPLAYTAAAISNRIFSLGRSKKEFDVNRYDRYMETIHLAEDRPFAHWTNHCKALLRLTHPKYPSPLPMFESLKESFLADPTSEEATVYRSFAKRSEGHPRERRIRHLKYYKLLETAQQLQLGGYTEETEWLLSQMRSLFPEMELEKDLKKGPDPPKHPPARYAEIQLNLPSFSGARTA